MVLLSEERPVGRGVAERGEACTTTNPKVYSALSNSYCFRYFLKCDMAMDDDNNY